jgi:hypothetical protein
MLKEIHNRHLAVQAFRKTANHLHSKQRMASKIEEVLLNPDRTPL